MEPQEQRQTRCPQCGGEPTAESVAEHQLGDLGYLHDDQKFVCSDCDNEYTHGVPVGDADAAADDLWCDVCDLGAMSVHRVRITGSTITLDLKCGHHHPFDCPKCNQHIPADALVHSASGEFHCPYCAMQIDRADAPFCFYWTQTERSPDDGGCALVGNPVLVGQTEGAEPYGYQGDADEPASLAED